jgi:hypothetical protein
MYSFPYLSDEPFFYTRLFCHLYYVLNMQHLALSVIQQAKN